jgi:S1-C subfamily serine protease
MKRWLALGLVLLACAPMVAQADTPKFLADMVAKNAGSLAVVQYTVEIETGNRTVMGQAICILNDKGLGMFLTTAIDSRMRVESLKDFQLITPGIDGKKIKAKLLGVDPWTGMGFVQATEKFEWQVVKFSPTSKLALGQEVGSVGLMMGDPSFPVYVGDAYVSCMIREPGDLVYVTGGRLTGMCSPVFAPDGRAVGIVGNQPFMGFQVPNQQGQTMNMQMRSQQESAFFTPVEEFVQVLDNIPADGKIARLPWMGINKFEAVGPDLADILKLDKPAIKIDEVIPDQPAAKAGLANRDIITAVDGKPLEKLATPELTVRNFVRKIMRMRAGEVLKLTVLSGQKTKEVSVTLADMPTRPDEAKQYFNKAIGILVREKVMLDDFLDKGDSTKAPGLIVLGMVKASASAVAGLNGGDVITNVNNQPVKTCDTFKTIVEKSLASSPSAPISFLVRRGEQAQVITVKPGTGG